MSKRDRDDGAKAGRKASLQGESTIRLLHRFRDGDKGALDELYRRYLGPLQRFASGQLPFWARDLMETDDLVQETLLKTLKHIDRFEPAYQGALGSYLRRGVKNRLQDEIRRVKRRPRQDDTARRAPDRGPSALEEVIGREARELYEAALDRLKPIDRELILMKVEWQFDYAEIAHCLGKRTPDAARMAVRRAVARLAKEMADGI